jgi:hypothetical protein
VLDYVLNRLKRWAYKERATSVHLHHAQVAEENKRAASGRVARVSTTEALPLDSALMAGFIRDGSCAALTRQCHERENRHHH